MAYDPKVADRLRDLLDAEPQLSEMKMFGGLAFLINGNMAIAASSEGGILVRVDPTESDKILDTSKAAVAVMRGRPMTGWLRIDPEHVQLKRQVAKWASLGASFARTLPPKR